MPRTKAPVADLPAPFLSCNARNVRPTPNQPGATRCEAYVELTQLARASCASGRFAFSPEAARAMLQRHTFDYRAGQVPSLCCAQLAAKFAQHSAVRYAVPAGTSPRVVRGGPVPPEPYVEGGQSFMARYCIKPVALYNWLTRASQQSGFGEVRVLVLYDTSKRTYHRDADPYGIDCAAVRRANQRETVRPDSLHQPAPRRRGAPPPLPPRPRSCALRRSGRSPARNASSSSRWRAPAPPTRST